MTLWLRTTRWTGPTTMTSVVAAEDLRADIHVTANATRTMFGDSVDVEIFEWEGGLEEATLEAARRAQERIARDKRYEDALHDFLIATFFATKKRTIIRPTSETPVDSETAKEILLSVMQHPAYQGQIVLLRTNDGKAVMLEKNLVAVRDPE